MHKKGLSSAMETKDFLNQPGMIDFSRLADADALSRTHKWLLEFLAEAKKDFKLLLQTPISQARYETVVAPHLTSGRPLSVLYTFIDTLNSVSANDATRKLIAEFEPKLVAFANEVSLNGTLYKLLTAALKKTKKSLERRSLSLLIKEMEHAGVGLNPVKRREISLLNKRLSALAQKFENNVIDSRKIFSYTITDELVLGYMPDADKNEARETAQKKGINGFVFTLLPPQYSAIMKYCTDRAIRKIFYAENCQIATKGKYDNRKLVLEILHLRHKKARLLGFKNFATYALEMRMAPSPGKVATLLDSVFKKALPGAKKECVLLAEFAKSDIPPKEFAEWDVSFYADRYRRSHFAFDDAKLRDYFELTRVIDGLFGVCKKLYGLTFREIKTAIYADGVRVYEVYRNKKLLSYYVADFYARPTKRGGAWCNMLREGYILTAEKGRAPNICTPILINVMNFPKPSKTHPSLLMHRDVETLFHEFGHAVHAMLSSTQLPNLNGFHVEWDFVEFPSQIFENWTWEKSVLKIFARHYKTNAALPMKEIDILWKLKTWMGGYHVVRQNEFGYLDMALHTRPVPKSVAALDALCLRLVSKRTVLPKLAHYRMYASFGHIFAGGYSAGYYSYLWAEILEADCYAYLKERGIMKASTGKLFAASILEPGTREPGEKLFKKLMKRDARIEPLLAKYGIA